MRKFVFMAALLLPFTAQAQMLDTKKNDQVSPKQTAALGKMIDSIAHIGACLSVWAAETRLNAATGMSILQKKDAASHDLGISYLRESRLDLARFRAGHQAALIVLPKISENLGLHFSTEEMDQLVQSGFMASDRAFTASIYGAFGINLEETSEAVAEMQTNDKTCVNLFTVLMAPKEFVVETPEVDTSKF